MSKLRIVVLKYCKRVSELVHASEHVLSVLDQIKCFKENNMTLKVALVIV